MDKVLSTWKKYGNTDAADDPSTAGWKRANKSHRRDDVVLVGLAVAGWGSCVRSGIEITNCLWSWVSSLK